jgi:hypothetical protein
VSVLCVCACACVFVCVVIDRVMGLKVDLLC